MFLSALSLVAALQVASVVVPETPLLAPRSYEATKTTDRLELQPRKSTWMTPAKAHALSQQRVMASHANRAALARMAATRRHYSPPTFVRGPTACDKGFEYAGNPEGQALQPLSKMPMARLEYAVARTIDGCPVAAPIVSSGQAR